MSQSWQCRNDALIPIVKIEIYGLIVELDSRSARPPRIGKKEQRKKKKRTEKEEGKNEERRKKKL